MGRKSLAEERRKQILKAFAICIRRYGLKDSSIERIAEEAGVRRSIIRHYIGNRDEVLKALVSHITYKYLQELGTAIKNVPQESFSASLLNYCFPMGGIEETEDDLVLQKLLATGEQDTLTRQLLLQMYKKLEEALITELIRVYPNANHKYIWSVAYSIVCLSFGSTSLIWLGISEAYNEAASECARILLHTLETN